ncbi:MAG: hypothetical protein AB1898_11285 [Acidobacteriota bacterium]
MLETNNREHIDQLKTFVLDHQVCYEVWPEYLIVKRKRVQVGFGLELCGIHGQHNTHPMPGCPQCYEVYTKLRKIAEWIEPQEERPSQYEIQPFDRALHESAKRRFRPEVTLTLKILHREGFDQPVDACGERCLKEMTQKLGELGATRGKWRSH